MKIKSEYPCGTKLEVSCFSLPMFLLGIVYLKEGNSEHWLCPLHGKDCIQNKVKR